MQNQPPQTDHDSAGQLDGGLALLGLSLSRDTRSALLGYLNLLHRWNRTYNLTAIRDPARMVSHHLLDSLAVVKPLQRTFADAGGQPAAVIDVGSGGGLPGVVLALVWPDVPVMLVEPVAKKCAFLRQCAAQLGLKNLSVQEQRIQNLTSVDLPDGGGRNNGSTRLFICRAYTALSDFVAQIVPLAAQGDWVAAMKSAKTEQEIGALSNRTEESSGALESVLNNSQIIYQFTEHLEVPGIDAERSLILLRALRNDGVNA